MWLVVVGPLVLGMMVALGGVDWSALGEAFNRGGKEAMSRAEAAGAAWAAGFAVLSITWSVIADRGALSGVPGDGAALVDFRTALRRTRP